MLQAPNEAADSINLRQKVSIAPLEEEEVPAAGEEEEEKNLPEWSEKVASGILTGQTQGPNPNNANLNQWHPNPRLQGLRLGNVCCVSLTPTVFFPSRGIVAELGPGEGG